MHQSISQFVFLGFWRSGGWRVMGNHVDGSTKRLARWHLVAVVGRNFGHVDFCDGLVTADRLFAGRARSQSDSLRRS